ncbi:MAG: RNA methyltransferase [Ignavibacteriales bacterium]|nr:RNA methyltransferase [Ignavibacteriales bacterium]
MLNEKFNNENILLYLENISEPGNLGTLLRTADWFGVKSVLISKNSVELFNPKVIRASMGSIFHLKIFTEVELTQFIYLKSNQYSFLCADLEGKNIFNYHKSGRCILSMANESCGPSQELLKLSDEVITVPKLGEAESLNVASAAAVILSQLTTNT